MTFVKIHGTILDSSVWGEDHSTRIVWLTMLAMADADGIVEASVSGLARRAVVTGSECRAALAIFLGPDEDSRDETTGERIEVVPGGWLVLNHQEYRDRQTTGQIRTAERVRKHRAKKKQSRLQTVTSNDVTPRNDLSPPDAEADTNSEAEVKEHTSELASEPTESALARLDSVRCALLDKRDHGSLSQAERRRLAEVEEDLDRLETELVAAMPDSPIRAELKEIEAGMRAAGIIPHGAPCEPPTPLRSEDTTAVAKAPHKGTSQASDAVAVVKPKRKRKPKKPREPSPGAVKIAQALYDAISVHSPDVFGGDTPESQAKTLYLWTLEIDRGLKAKEVTVDDALLVIEYAHHPDDVAGNPGFSWHTNMCAGESMRNQWKKKTLLAKAKRWQASTGPNGAPRRPGEGFDFVGAGKAWKQAMEVTK